MMHTRSSLARLGAVAAALVLFLGIVLLMLTREGADALVRWVSPSGHGNTCSSARPCSLATAQAQTRASAPTMSSDLVVRLMGGTYHLTEPLRFGVVDSGTGGHVVRYEAAPGADPVISGAKQIDGWTIKDRAKNIWQAPVPATFTSRQLYVNGVRAKLASRPVADTMGSLTQTSTGYTSTNVDIGAWPASTDTELVFPGGGNDPDPAAIQSVAPWTWSMCGVGSVNGANVVVDTPCYQNATNPFHVSAAQAQSRYVTKPVTVQNNYALLGTAGQFYLDDAADRVYYVPRAGENLGTATVTMPQVSSFLSATSVHDLQFVGLTFEYATWAPSPTLGVVDIQANVLATRSPLPGGATSDLGTIPSAVSFTKADRVLFERNVVRHVGGAGVAFTGGGTGDMVRGNVVTDASAGGINLGDGKGLSLAASYERHALVTDNLVSDVAVEFQGGAAIFAGWVKHTTISHNEISDVPWVGISLGWGWNAVNDMVDNHVDRNIVRNSFGSSLRDGGAIYVLGRERGSAASTISGNFVSGDPQPYGGIYLDSGASHFRVTGNVVEKAAYGWLFLQNLNGGKAFSNVISGNYTDTATVFPSIKGTDASNTLTNNHVGLSSWPAAAQAIINAAGLEPTFDDIR